MEKRNQFHFLVNFELYIVNDSSSNLWSLITVLKNSLYLETLVKVLKEQ